MGLSTCCLNRFLCSAALTRAVRRFGGSSVTDCASAPRLPPRLKNFCLLLFNFSVLLLFFFFFFFFYKKPVTLLCGSDTHRGELVVPAVTPHACGASDYWVRELCALSRRNEPRMMAFCILPAKISAEFRHAGMIFSSDSSVCLIPPRAPIFSTTILTVWPG